MDWRTSEPQTNHQIPNCLITMATSLTEVESQVIELSTEAFKTFCDHVGGMFGVGIQCEPKEVRPETVAGLKKCFKKLVAVNVVDATGALDGTFQLIFDQEGLFTLGGVIIMLPEQRILANRRDPSPELAASMVDAVGEAGNLLVGSWDRVFQEGLKGHGHFLQRLPSFVGKPWDEPQGKIALPGDGELMYVPYEMTIGSYPSFKCGVIFPKTLFADKSDSGPGSTTSDETAPPDVATEVGVPQDTEAGPKQTDSKESDLSDTSDTPQDSDNGETKRKPPAAEEALAGAEAAAKENTLETHVPVPSPASEEKGGGEDAAQDTAGPEQHGAVQESTKKKSKPKRRAAKKAPAKETGPSEAHEEPAAGRVSEAIRKLTQSPAILHEGSAGWPHEPSQPIVSESAACRAYSGFFSICAKDIMQGQVIWASPDETVQQALAKMQQHDTGYVMVGADGALEGIVSRSDIAGALSPYLRSLFAKWRRPLDDATLKIKIKWIMSRPVRTVKPQTSLVTMIENVCRFGGGALPVVDEESKVQGLVTVFGIFQMMLNTFADVSTVGRAPQTSPLT